MVYTLNTLLVQYQGPATKLATALWEEFPALFPAFATDLVEGVDLKALAFDVTLMVKDTPGAWNVFTLARELILQ